MWPYLLGNSSVKWCNECSQEWSKDNLVNCIDSRLHTMKQFLQDCWMNEKVRFILQTVCLATVAPSWASMFLGWPRWSFGFESQIDKRYLWTFYFSMKYVRGTKIGTLAVYWYPCCIFWMFSHQTSPQGLSAVTEVFLVFISPETFRDCSSQLTTRLLPSTSFARYCFSPLPSVDTSNWVQKMSCSSVPGCICHGIKRSKCNLNIHLCLV